MQRISLDGSPHELVRAAIARHPSTPSAMLDALAHDNSRMVCELARVERLRRSDDASVADPNARLEWDTTF